MYRGAVRGKTRIVQYLATSSITAIVTQKDERSGYQPLKEWTALRRETFRNLLVKWNNQPQMTLKGGSQEIKKTLFFILSPEMSPQWLKPTRRQSTREPTTYPCWSGSELPGQWAAERNVKSRPGEQGKSFFVVYLFYFLTSYLFFHLGENL